jgi:hypothetical protein
MTKPEALDAIKLLSALESWAYCTAHPLPDHMEEQMQGVIEVLEKIVLAKEKA